MKAMGWKAPPPPTANAYQQDKKLLLYDNTENRDEVVDALPKADATVFRSEFFKQVKAQGREIRWRWPDHGTGCFEPFDDEGHGIFYDDWLDPAPHAFDTTGYGREMDAIHGTAGL